MLRIKSAFVGLVFAGLAAVPSGAAEIGAHTMLNADQSVPWRAVGRVNVIQSQRRGMCTGTLIAPDLVLTAAHCVVHPRSGLDYPPGNIHFVAGWHKGHGTGHSRAIAVAVHPGWRRTGSVSRERLESDLALIRLEVPLAAKAAHPFTTDEPPLPGDPLTLVSYRRDRPHALTYQDDCSYRAVVGLMLHLDCAVTFGSSGAPVFALVDGKLQVVAVLSAMWGGENPQAFAVRADKAIEILLPLLAENR